MKRILSLFVVLTMLFTIAMPMNIAPLAQDYYYTDMLTENIKWTLSDGELLFTGSGEFPDWDGERPWEEYGELVETAVVRGNITKLTSYTFTCLENLKSITLTKSLREFENEVIHDCRALEEITIDTSNAYFTTVDGVLFDKEMTTLIKYPGGKTDEFYEIPDSVSTVVNGAFGWTQNLTWLYIPGSVEDVGEYGVTGIHSLESFEVDPDSDFFTTDDCGALFSKDMTKLIAYPVGRGDIDYSMPYDVRIIGADAFNCATSLVNVKLPESLIEIGSYAFANCTLLDDMSIPDSVTTIKTNAFGWCENLKNITIGRYAMEISDRLFEGHNPELTIYGFKDTPIYAHAMNNNIKFVVIGSSSGGSSGGGGGTHGGCYYVSVDYDDTLINVSVVDTATSMLIGNSVEYDENGEAVLDIIVNPINGATAKALYVNDVLWNDSVTVGNAETIFSGVVINSDSEIRIEAERVLPVNISFPKEAYVDGTVECRISVYSKKYTSKAVYEYVYITDTKDFTVNVNLNEIDDSQYTLTVNLTSQSGTKTNLTTEEIYYYNNSVSGNLIADYWSRHTINLNPDTKINVTLPYSKMVKGKLILPDDYYAEDGAVLSGLEAWYTDEDGEYADYTNGSVDSDYNFMVPIPDDLNGKYTLSVRPVFTREDDGSGDDSASEYYDYYPVTNLVLISYDYVDESGKPKYFEINGEEDVNNVVINLETGYIVSGSVKFPEDAVIGDAHPVISVSGYDADTSEFIDGEGEYWLSLNTDGVTDTFDFSFAVSSKTKNLILGTHLRMDKSGSDEVTPNIIEGNFYYVSNDKSTPSAEDATIINMNGNKTGLVLMMKTGFPMNLTTRKVSGDTSYIYADIVCYSSNGEGIVDEFWSVGYSYSSATDKLIVPKGYDKMYVSYDINEEYSSLYADYYTDKVFVNPDGSYSTNMEDAEMWTVKENGEIDFTFATKSNINTAAGNTVFNVIDTTTQEIISDAQINITNEDGTFEKQLVSNSNGKAVLNLTPGLYQVVVFKNGYETRTVTIDKKDEQNEYTVYLSSSSILDIDTKVKEMSYEDIIDAGIDPDAIGNQNVYNCTAVLRFTDVTVNLNYICTDNEVLVCEPVKTGNKVIYATSKDIYLIIHSNVTWLKEMFDVQLIVANTSAIENVEDCIASLNLPDGISLAVMKDEQQSTNITLGDIAPGESSEAHWYVCGDNEGEYILDGTVVGTRVGGGLSENINVNFSTKEPICVLGGSALKLTIEAERTAVTGQPYRVQYTLQNVSNKELYNVSLNLLGGKFFRDYSASDLQYDPDKTYGGEIIGDDENGYVLKADKFKPGDMLSGIFEITFAEGLYLEDGIRYMLADMFTITGNGSTVTIPTDIVLVDTVVKHNWGEGTVTTPATCTEDGVLTFTCTDSGCNETKTAVIPANGHDFDEWTTSTPASCETDGEKRRDCKNCNHYEISVINAYGHNWDDEYTVDVEPGCETEGSKSIHCLRCTAKTDVQTIPEKGHAWSDWNVRTAETCDTDGLEYRTCSRCMGEETRTRTKLGHDWSKDYIVDVEPGCTTDGSKSKHCSRCSEKNDVKTIAKKGHTWGNWTVRTAETCDADGLEYRTCSVCSTEETRVRTKLGHDWSKDYIVDVEPTCTTDGSKSKHCSRCSEKNDIKTIASPGHSWDNGTITVKPTQTTGGEKVYACQKCGATKTENLPKLESQLLEFARFGDITVTYGQFEYVDNMAYNDSENGSELVYTSSNPEVATVNENGRAKIIGAGETIITATAPANDYYIETAVSYKLTVKKAPLTITASDVEAVYGDLPEFKDYVATGFVLKEDESVLGGKADFKCEYTQYAKAGTYKISVSGITSKNYDITFADGTLTVKKATDYKLELSNLTHRKGKVTHANVAITPKDDTAVMKIEYNTNGVWSEELPSEIGDYKVRVSLKSSDNIEVKSGYYAEADFVVKAGAMIDIDGEGGLAIDTVVDGDKAEFKISDEDVATLVDNIPSTGEVVIDAKGTTDGVKELTIPSNIIDALDESEKAKTLTVLADDAEITMDTNVLSTVADKVSGEDKISIHIDAVEKEELNAKQQEALDSIGGDNAVILQLNLVVTKADGSENVHELGGKVDVRAAYTLPSDMIGKRILVCYVADDGSVSYVRATYEDGFVSFNTNHFSHYVLLAMPCPHDWNEGTVITEATASQEGLIRYECSLCDETKDETISKLPLTFGGGGGATNTASYIVKFETNGAGTLKSVKVAKDKTLSAPEISRDGYIFGGWFTDKEFTALYDFDAEVTSNITLYAKWIEEGKEADSDATDDNADATLFDDVTDNDWFAQSVKYVVENKLMNGVSDKTFAPHANLTRAMLVTVLYRNEGEPSVADDTGEIASVFADVSIDSYYAKAVIWAQKNGIVNGVTETEFAPDANITREQIATIMHRYAQYKEYDVSVGENTNILSYNDAESISEYAVSSIQYAVGSGLINGKTESTLNPHDSATRAEIAAVLMRFIENNK